MKASIAGIYDIGIGGMVTRPMGWAGLQMDLRLHLQYICVDGIVGEDGGMHIHNSFGGVSFTGLGLMEMSMC